MNPQDKATELIQTYGLDFPPVPITEIANTQGLLLRIANFGEFAHQVSGYLDPEQHTAYVNQEDDENRQAATIAFLLGQQLMQPEELAANEDLRVCWRSPFTELANDPLNASATEFAACLLLPPKLLEEYRSKNFVTPQQLANLFGVPQDVVTYRLQHAK